MGLCDFQWFNPRSHDFLCALLANQQQADATGLNLAAKGILFLCKLPAEKLIFDLLEENGGPLIWPRITEQEQDNFDASCRKLYRLILHTNAPHNALKIV